MSKKNQSKITPKQLQILLLLYRFRFLTTPHIQHFLNHKSPYRIRTWLKHLHDQQLVHRIYDRQFGGDAQPAIYYLHKNALKILQTLDDVNPNLLNRFYREKHKSQRFIDRCLIIADTYKQFLQKTQNDNQNLTFYTKIDHEDFEFLTPLLPDAGVVLRDKSGNTRRYFLEVFQDGTPRYAIRNRLKQYLEYYIDNQWEQETRHEFPTILLIAGNASIYRFLNKHVKDIREEEIDDIHFTIINKSNKLKI